MYHTKTHFGNNFSGINKEATTHGMYETDGKRVHPTKNWNAYIILFGVPDELMS